MDEATRFQKLVQLRVPDSLSGMIEAAANKHLQSKSEYVRQALLAGLRADGYDPAAIPTRDAGTLYDSRGGRQRYAKVDGDQIGAVSYHDDYPGEGWLPVVHVDSEPFDSVTHWRLAPVYTIEADRVVCTYPVVAKSLEAI